MRVQQLAGMASNRSVAFATAYACMEANDWSYSISSLPTYKLMSEEEVQIIHDTWNKKRGPKSTKLPNKWERKQIEFQAARSFFQMVKSRPKIKAMRKCISLLDWFYQFQDNHVPRTELGKLIKPDKNMWYTLGQFVAERERAFINARMRGKVEKPLCQTLPLYACSGELEADTMDRIKIQRIAVARGKSHEIRSHTVTTMWRHSDSLEFKRDGGGQAETTFLINEPLARLVTGCVRTIGRPNRNGGHIHINCQGDEAIGRRVFAALRFHLCWTRWLAGQARRHHNWSSIDNVADTFDDGHVKGCALTKYTWNRTGTVEMRIWPTSHKAEDWIGRRDIMQAIARWSETFSPIVHPINQETEAIAWPMFFQWASTNAPKALVYVLNQFRKRARSSVLNPADKEAAIRLMGVFEQSGVTVPGYRRRRLVGQSN